MKKSLMILACSFLTLTTMAQDSTKHDIKKESRKEKREREKQLKDEMELNNRAALQAKEKAEAKNVKTRTKKIDDTSDQLNDNTEKKIKEMEKQAKATGRRKN